MKINWRVRLRSKTFWMVLIPAVLYLAKTIGRWFGFEIDTDLLSAEGMILVDSIFLILMTLGIVVDPTTDGLSDSKRAMNY